MEKNIYESVLNSLKGDSSTFETISTVDVEDFVFLGGFYTKIGIPSNAPDELERNISAGLIAYFQDYSSIDYVAKRVLKSKKRNKQVTEDVTFEISQTIKKEIIKAIKRFDEIENRPSNHGSFAAKVCLIRLFISFRSALVMIRLGMSFEAACLSRLILEQIAWAYNIHDLDEGVFDVSPPKSITNLKSIISYAGRLYGTLTKDAHITPSETSRYLDFDEEKVNIILSSKETVKLNAYYLLILTDAYLIVSEMIYRDFHTSFQYIEKDSLGEFRPKENTEFKKFIKKIKKILFDEK